MKIVINTTYGGFHPSQNIVDEMIARGALKPGSTYLNIEDRTDKVLVEIVERLEENCPPENLHKLSLRVIEIPDHNAGWYILQYDGAETVIVKEYVTKEVVYS